ncbi:MAG: hypothetical protein U0174_04595 [Polyangiaceae bacterium]
MKKHTLALCVRRIRSSLRTNLSTGGDKCTVSDAPTCKTNGSRLPSPPPCGGITHDSAASF